MTQQKNIPLADFEIGNQLPLILIAGPCQIESRDHAFKIAEALAEITHQLDIPFIFKASYDKANRSSLSSSRGVGIDLGLKILAEIKAKIGCPIITDVHETDQCITAASVADVLQIPALLSRQTDLIVAAANTGKVVNIKKGQFLAPWDMDSAAKKAASTGNDLIMLCERGTSFGYNNLVNDMRSLPIMAQIGYPVIFDATHSVQSPGKSTVGLGNTGGDRTMVPFLARAAVAIGVAGLFIETHDDPDNAPSDGANMVHLNDMEDLLYHLKMIDDLIKTQSHVLGRHWKHQPEPA